MGHLPIPLNETGKKQAEDLATELKDKGIEAIFSSDLIRTEETTKIINSTLNVPVTYFEELREHSLGKCDGMSIDEILGELDTLEKFDDLMVKIDGETTGVFVDRVWNVFEKIVKTNQDKENILILTHGGCNRSIISKILDASEIIFDNLKQENCCINEIVYTNKGDKDNFLIESVNHMCHIR